MILYYVFIKFLYSLAIIASLVHGFCVTGASGNSQDAVRPISAEAHWSHPSWNICEVRDTWNIIALGAHNNISLQTGKILCNHNAHNREMTYFDAPIFWRTCYFCHFLTTYWSKLLIILCSLFIIKASFALT